MCHSQLPHVLMSKDRACQYRRNLAARELKKAVEDARAKLLKADDTVKEGCKTKVSCNVYMKYNVLHKMLYYVS